MYLLFQRINALNEGTETNNSISIPLLKAMDKNDKSNTADPDYQFYVSYDFYKKDNPHFHRGKLYGFNQGNGYCLRIYCIYIHITTSFMYIRCIYLIIFSKEYKTSTYSPVKSYFDEIATDAFVISKGFHRFGSIL